MYDIQLQKKYLKGEPCILNKVHSIHDHRDQIKIRNVITSDRLTAVHRLLVTR